MSNNISWDLPTKSRWLATMQEHQVADRFIQGVWLDDKDDQGLFRGCFFGCAMQSEDHPLEEAIKDMHLPPWLIYLAEKIFEGLPKTEAKLFPVQLLKAVPVDTDLSGVECKQHISRLSRLLDLPDLPDNVISAISGVQNCWTQRLNGVPESGINWSASSRAAVRATWSAEKATATAASASASESAEASVSASASAEASAEAIAASVRAARAALWETERDVLIQWLNEVSGE